MPVWEYSSCLEMSWDYSTSRKAIASEASELHQLGRICQLAELDELREFGELRASKASTLGAGVDDISPCATLGDRLYRCTGYTTTTTP